MAERWRGDGTYFLPAGEVEPYRLWFEFLKLALTDPDIDVDARHYEPWGNVASLSFNNWWGLNWRRLFGLKSGVIKLEPGSIVGSDPSHLTVQIPLAGKTDEILSQIAKLLEDRDGFHLERQGLFGFTVGYEQGFIKQMDKARRYLRLYSYWMKHKDLDRRKRLDRAATDYARWYAAWEPKVRAKGSKLRVTPMPIFYKVYVAYLDQKALGKRERGGQASFGDVGGSAEMARRQIARDIRLARKLAANVSCGEFPGVY